MPRVIVIGIAHMTHIVKLMDSATNPLTISNVILIETVQCLLTVEWMVIVIKKVIAIMNAILTGIVQWVISVPLTMHAILSTKRQL